MGVCNSELYNNLALCCFYSQQHDMAVMCFERALAFATDETLSDVWYNIGHLALVIYFDFHSFDTGHSKNFETRIGRGMT